MAEADPTPLKAGALTACAPAKINLYLHVTGRRQDGYHLLDSLAVFAGAADRLTARPAPDLSLTLAGPQAGALAGDGVENLVLRAARALRERHGVAAGAALTLDKHLPVASGIGGGSADAAAALRLLAALWGVDAERAALAEIGARLGADVPVCLASRPARMAGIGELLAPPPRLPPFGLLLVNPGAAVSTPAVFRARTPGFSAPARLPAGWADAARMAADLAALGNDLQAPAQALCPAIGTALAAIRATTGCLLARMSGSGATCFGLFASAGAARDAAGQIPHGPGWCPGWWVWAGAPADAAARRQGTAGAIEAAPPPPY